MLRIFAIHNDFTFSEYSSFENMDTEKILWYWADFDAPNEKETKLLSSHFHFHHLAIEDCGFLLNNPKIDFYANYNFIIANALKKDSLCLEEIALFVSKNYIVSYHHEASTAVDSAWTRCNENPYHWPKGPAYVAHQIVDKIVDEFFPAVTKIEERLSGLENNNENKTTHEIIDEVFDARKDLLKLRKVVNSMRDLVYRVLNSERIHGFEEHNMYFSDIHDHLLKLSDMIESCREMTADIRDSYLSINSAHMNRNMMVLTVITTIFIPLTFIVGVYGMNFQNMPELTMKYGYFIVLFIMLGMGIGMFYWFRKKGWFDN